MTETTRWRPATPWIAITLLAAVATVAVGDGNLLADGASELHLDPIHFLHQILYAWTPTLFLGFHTGAMHLYVSAATLIYALLFVSHVPLVLAQRIVDFLYFYAIAAGMYWALGEIAPELNRTARFCGAAACLFNPYVAFNTNGSTPFLLLYAEIPWLTGVTAAVARGRWSALTGAVVAAAVTLIGSGNNMPLTLLAALVATLYALVSLAIARRRVALFGRFALFAVYSFGLGVLVNLYWIGPAVDWYRTAWIGGVLDETPSLHNGDSSFANVFRGLGQWAIFDGDAAGPWYRWAASYRSGAFASLLWVTVATALWAPTFRRARTKATVFFLAVIFVATPLAVGYYRGALGDAITTPIYDLLYWHLPGFQVFRASYKLVSPVTFAIAGLFAIAIDASTNWIAERKLAAALRRRCIVIVEMAAIVLVVAGYLPVVIHKANDPLVPVPSWVRNERTFVARDVDHRVALFPTQYADRFAWGSPMYEMENGLIDRGAIHGYLGSAANQGSNQWIMRAFHATRDDDPSARNIFAVLSASDLLQRDDFENRLTPDFAFPSGQKSNTTTTAHDLITRVLGARLVARDGANRSYRLPSALPLSYAVERPTLSADPAVSGSEDLANMARGAATISTDDVGASDVVEAVAAGAVPSTDPTDLDALTTTVAKLGAVRLDVQVPEIAFNVATTGSYVPFVTNTEFFRQPDRSFGEITLDGKALRMEPRRGSGWRPYAPVYLSAGSHHLSVPGASWSQSIRVKFVERVAWTRLRSTLGSLAHESPFRVERDVDSPATIVDITKRATYRISATASSNRGSFVTDEPVGPRPVPFATLTRSLDRSLAFVPLGGTDDSEATMMPQAWYTRPEIYTWNRANEQSWLLLARESHLLVLGPSHPTTVVFDAKLAALSNVSPVPRRRFTIWINGAYAATFSLGGGSWTETTLNARTFRYAAPLESLRLRLALRPGANDVRIAADGRDAVRGVDIGANASASGADERFVAVLAPTSEFVTKSVGRVATMRALDAAHGYRAYELALPTERLDGDPHLLGSVAVEPSARAVAARLVLRVADDRARSKYLRSFPLRTDGTPFDVEVAASLPNVANDDRLRIERAFIVVVPRRPVRPFARAGPRPEADPPLVRMVYRRAVLAPRQVGSMDIDRAAVFSQGLAAHVTRSRTAIAVSFDSGVPARTTTVDLPLPAIRPSERARFVLPLAVDWLASNVRFEMKRDDGVWHLVGNRVRLQRAGSMRSGTFSATTYRVPFGVDVGSDDVATGHVSLELDGRPLDLEPSGANDTTDVHLEYRDDRLATVTVTRAGGSDGELALIAMPSEWITASDNRIYASLPARLLASAHGRTAVARVRLDFAPDFALDKRRTAEIFAPRWYATTQSETRDRTSVLVDGRRVRDDDVPLGVGRHVVVPVDPAQTLAHLEVTGARATPAKLVSVTSVRRSPVALAVTMNPHSVPQLLVFGESYHPEWRAELDGHTLSHVVVNGFENGWLVPPDASTRRIAIEFTAQTLYERTLAISIATVVCIALGAIAIRFGAFGVTARRFSRRRVANRPAAS